jgi:hypothetical protein
LQKAALFLVLELHLLPQLEVLYLCLPTRAHLPLDLLRTALSLPQDLQVFFLRLLQEVLSPLQALIERLDLDLQFLIPDLQLFRRIQLANYYQVLLLGLFNGSL